MIDKESRFVGIKLKSFPNGGYENSFPLGRDHVAVHERVQY